MLTAFFLPFRSIFGKTAVNQNKSAMKILLPFCSVLLWFACCRPLLGWAFSVDPGQAAPATLAIMAWACAGIWSVAWAHDATIKHVR